MLLAAILEKNMKTNAVHKILTHLDLPFRPPDIAPAVLPAQMEMKLWGSGFRGSDGDTEVQSLVQNATFRQREMPTLSHRVRKSGKSHLGLAPALLNAYLGLSIRREASQECGVCFSYAQTRCTSKVGGP